MSEPTTAWLPENEIRQATLAAERARVLVVGDVMLDRYWFGDAQRISPEAPVPVVRVVRQDSRLGAAGNVAKNAAALGAQVGLLGVVGDDEPGREVESLLANTNIRSHLHRDPALPTTIKLRVIARQQQLVRVDFEDVPAHDILMSKLDEYKTLLPDYDIVLLSDYAKGGLAHVSEMISIARSAGKVVLVDPKGDDYRRYSGATLVTPNRAELRAVVGAWRDEDDLAQRVERLRAELGLAGLLLTRSEEGMTLFEAAQRFHVSAQTREVFDVTGAGDTVIATLAVMLGGGVGLRAAVQIANRAGGIVVGKVGTAVVTPEELFALTAEGLA